ncbi:hypothetical protein EGW08_019004, partial [Elysia chlorotica]
YTLSDHVLSFVEAYVQQRRENLRKKLGDLGPKSRSSSSMMEYLDLLLHDIVVDEQLEYGWENLRTLEVCRESKLPAAQRWQSAQRLMDFLIPDSPPAWRSSPGTTRNLVKGVLRNKPAVRQILRFLRYEWNNQGRVGRGKSENLLKERCKSTAWIVSAGFFSSLLLIWDELDVKNEVIKLE